MFNTAPQTDPHLWPFAHAPLTWDLATARICRAKTKEGFTQREVLTTTSSCSV